MKMRQLIVIAISLATTLEISGASFADDASIDPQLFSKGLDLYNENCAICHGEDGDGKGPLSSGFSPPPANLTNGVFKIRSSGTGEFPTQADLERTIRNGIDGSYGRSMPMFEHFNDEEVRALIEVIRAASGSLQFGAEVAVAPQPDTIDLEVGAVLYQKLNCIECHGENGDGAGRMAPTLTDSSGNKIRPADFRTGRFKGGNEPEDIWMRLYTGMDGTPMQSFGRGNSDDELWALVEYIRQFSGTN